MPVKSGFTTNGTNWGGRRVGEKWARGGRRDWGQAGREEEEEDQDRAGCRGPARLILWRRGPTKQRAPDRSDPFSPSRMCTPCCLSQVRSGVPILCRVLVPFAAADGSVFGVKTQLYAKSTLPASLTVFPSLSTATSLTTNFHTRVCPSVIHDRGRRLFGFKGK